MKKSIVAVALIAAFTVASASSAFAWERKSMKKWSPKKGYRMEMPMKKGYTPKPKHFDPCYFLPGNTASATQFGYQNNAAVSQKGCANQGHILQGGAYNNGSINQHGIGNQGLILQGGVGDSAHINQHGFGNSAVITQN